MSVDVARIRGLLITVFHLVVIALSLITALLLRYDFSLDNIETFLFWMGLLVALPVKLSVFVIGGLQRGWWRYAGLMDLARLGVVNAVASAFFALSMAVFAEYAFPRSVLIIDLLLCFLMTSGARFCFRLYTETWGSESAPAGKGVLIYGAGSTGRTLAREIRLNPLLGYQLVGFIDDEPSFRSASIMNVPVLGTGRDIGWLVDSYRDRTPRIDEVIVAISPAGRGLQSAMANCRAAGIRCRAVPGIADILTNKNLSSQIPNVSLEDLLGREQARLEEHRIQKNLSGKSILVTGAAGSIGSELCRQAAAFSPQKLVLLDRAESDLFEIDHQLRHQYPHLKVVPVVGDIQDSRTLEDVIREHSITSIYHAAAYKHVPMMEAHVLEAVRNNVIGTLNLVKAAHKYRVSDFLMISSDKAVNPTSVMGVTKRIAELIVSAIARQENNFTKFVSVRFGNVLGSNGSVVPLFQSQIATGGPVTVTHPEMRRYFMSILEAVQLVLQASTMGQGSEIFVLDMGEPVRILDLAKNMIRLTGLIPGRDIEIRITGLRPGEKLFEEIALDGEDMLPTHHEKIRIFKGEGVDPKILSAWVTELQLLIARRNDEQIKRHLCVLVPEYDTGHRLKGRKVETTHVRAAAAGIVGSYGLSSMSRPAG